MDPKRLNELTTSFLINSSQSAYVESAEGTLSIIECYSDFFRYATGGIRRETLFKELEILDRFVKFHKIRYHDCVQVHVKNDPAFKSVFVKSMSAIDFFDAMIYDVFENAAFEIKAAVTANVSEDQAVLTVRLSYGEKSITRSKVLTD